MENTGGSAKSLSPDDASQASDSASSKRIPQPSGASVSDETSQAIPPYDGSPFVIINNNLPSFTDDELKTTSYAVYGDLDALGRCTAAMACVGQELMPTGERGEIGSVKPTGWHLVKYDGIDGNYLYNRCHLIGYQLTGENANAKNLITGTRYLNTEGMLPFEEQTASYIRRTGNHVLYRVTPVFTGDHLLADGVRMEAKSVEDDGEGVCFHVFCYNVQPGIVIDYATGDSSGEAFSGTENISDGFGNTSPDTTAKDFDTTSQEQSPDAALQGNGTVSDNGADIAGARTYILNKNTHKFHVPSCESVTDMKEKNKKEFIGTRDELIRMGYSPCGRCHP
ncbi:MAG: DNA/RNA non-specific endonuclease [Lachnospiraceae bacterium]|nr:DNA/RNA non-specific endonuclease [Lachnospiraceae bacterium]